MSLAFARKQLKSLIARGKRSKIRDESLERSVSIFEQHAKETGLSDEDIDLCSKLIMKCLSIKNTKRIILCMIPKTVISNAVVRNMILWMLSNYHKVARGCIVAVLQWITGLLDYHLVDAATIDGFYTLYYFLLHYSPVDVHASRLIYKLTKPGDVTRGRVLQLLDLQSKSMQKRVFYSLLSLFKSYRPELVPEFVPSMQMNLSYGALPDELSSRFQEAERRKQTPQIEEDWKDNIDWNVGKSRSRGVRRTKMELIPEIDYIHFGSHLYREKELHNILDFRKFNELGCYQLSLNMPSNLLCLLGTQAGHHILAFSKRATQSAFSYMLYYTLHSVFSTREVGAVYDEKKKFLERIYSLEEYMQQGIPVVSRFLAQFLHMWDGIEFQQEILNLLEWITFSSFDELYHCILLHLQTLFIVSSVEVKCSIIRMFRRMYQNVLHASGGSDGKQEGVFLQAKVDWDKSKVAKLLSGFISKLLQLSLSCEPQQSILLDEALLFYEVALVCESMGNFLLWSIVPPAVAYRGLFTRDTAIMNRVCGILLRYRSHTYPSIRERGLRSHFTDKIMLVNKYVTDFMNCMWNNVAFENRSKGYIFTDVRKESITKLLRYVEADQAFNLTNGYVTALFTYMAFVPHNLHPRQLRKAECHVMLREFFPNVDQFIKLCNEKMSHKQKSHVSSSFINESSSASFISSSA